MGWFRRIYSFDYMGHKRWWFTVSGVIIAAGLISMFVRGGGNPVDGLKYGLEFKTGTRASVTFERSVDIGAVRDELTKSGYADTVIQQISAAGVGSRFQISLPALGQQQEQQLKEGLDKQFGIANYNSQTVGPTFGRQVITSSYKAVVLALLLILVYVSIRFTWKFAIGAIVAEVHDLLIVIGIYSLVGREVTTATIAAVLTILGYSLYDTVIVFDRIRENEPRMTRSPFADIANRSIWETLTRSINTTMMTLIPVVCLLLFGGATLKDFAFALLVGIGSGAFSSIFVASPVVTILKEREPEYGKLATRARDAQ